jgi:uncharacterized protein
MRIWDKIRNSLAALGLAAMAATAAAPADARAAKPALWKVYDRDTEIYLFGTVHLLPPGTQWRTAAFDKAAKQSGTLVVETIIDEKNPQAFAMELARLSVRPGLPPLLDRVRPERRASLAVGDCALGDPGRRAQQYGDLGRRLRAPPAAIQGARRVGQ